MDFVPSYRPDSNDLQIWVSVFCNNEYAIGELSADAVVVDVGAHIGAFSCLCLSQGARRITAYEPDAQSCALAEQNIVRFAQALGIEPASMVVNRAIWRSDTTEPLQLVQAEYSGLAQGINHAAQTTFFEGPKTRAVDSVGLDQVLAELSQVDLLKLDCEGAEWPILMTATQLHKVRCLVLEVHALSMKAAEFGRPMMASMQPFASLSLDDLCARLRGFGLHLVRDKIWHGFLGNPDYYFGPMTFERR